MDEATKKAYQQWLSQQKWDWFWTGTFRKNYTPDGARRAAERFYRGFIGKEVACLFIESGSLYGKVHLHGLLRFREGGRPTVDTLSGRWFDSYGYNRLETPRSLESVSRYCSKYLTKHAKDETYIIL